MSAVIDVPKPDDAGSGVTAIANTKMAYANIRSGPGVNYRDVGDLRNNTLVLYFPNTRTSDDWYWMELKMEQSSGTTLRIWVYVRSMVCVNVGLLYIIPRR